MACAAENVKAVCGEASRHACKASPVYYNLARPKFFVPTGRHAGKRWPHTVHDLRRCFRTNGRVPQYTSRNTGNRPTEIDCKRPQSIPVRSNAPLASLGPLPSRGYPQNPWPGVAK